VTPSTTLIVPDQAPVPVLQLCTALTQQTQQIVSMTRRRAGRCESQTNGSRHHVKRWSQHRPDVLTDPNYWADEDIEECLE